MRSIVQSLSGFAVFAAIAFSWLFALTFWNRRTLWRDRDQYKRESLVVTESVYDSGAFEDHFEFYWLEDIVGGVTERLVPDLDRAPSPRSADELALRYPKGTKISVLYNPAATAALIQGESLRVIDAPPDFWKREASRRLFFGPLTLGPIPLALGIYLAVRFTNRRHLARQTRQDQSSEPFDRS
jgi:hypothetical protein